MLQQYDRLVITRSDFFYLCPHPPLELLQSDKIWIPNGEHYGGITDRHLIVNRQYAERALSACNAILERPNELLEEMRWRNNWNLEQYLDYHFRKTGIRHQCRFFPWIMYTIRDPAESSRWTMGRYNRAVNQIVKYPSELDAAERWARKYAVTHDWYMTGFGENA